MGNGQDKEPKDLQEERNLDENRKGKVEVWLKLKDLQTELVPDAIESIRRIVGNYTFEKDECDRESFSLNKYPISDQP